MTKTTENQEHREKETYGGFIKRIHKNEVVVVFEVDGEIIEGVFSRDQFVNQRFCLKYGTKCAIAEGDHVVSENRPKIQEGCYSHDSYFCQSSDAEMPKRKNVNRYSTAF